ncbi:glutamine--tRNA ligase [Psychrosphaera sp. B3R10]|uniref:glutamine--tRNA ligase n=1 Tax=unclassified Psychrosphaera TaxID=2641570 RepID=UPI001C087A6A|nr:MULTISPECIES: glutamine--tRNA ligase [unclassified Psychrosphaera]MBU2882307.1 glutamine--tRNA ligase [Psychrosphaera sp. I2R16]MBU2988988.1 glutamine--tRNA ligase [Psychrosphaera sp. B3R10]
MAEMQARPTNFIRNIIDADLEAGKHQTTHTRFPPEPNGYLHIGHAKSIVLNFGIAKDYNGFCNLRFDDTNPEKEDIDYVNAIKKDVNWLGYQWHDEVRYSSNYFDQLFGFAEELISKGLAYVEFSNQEEIRSMRGTLTSPGKNSPYRDVSIEENLKHFHDMRDGKYKEGECCLRAKIDMSSSFMCMRDPVIYRIRYANHHQTGDKWCIYPMYDFTHCISDAIENITHSLCTLEFQDNRRLYDWVLDNITIESRPHQYEFSRLNLEYTMMSKRKLNTLVTENYVSGWDDPRMPTIAGLRRRGYTAAAIQEFCQRIGVTKMENTVEMGMLEACIRDDLNENAPRAMAVLDPIKVVIENYPTDSVEWLDAPNHPNNEDMGSRKLPFTREVFIEREDFREEANKKYKRLVIGKEVRLRNAYFVKAERCDKDENGEITTIYCTYDDTTLGKLPADGRKAKGVIHWVSASEGVPAEIRDYDRLFTVPNPAAAESIDEILNPDSLIIRNGFIEPSLLESQAQQAFQFERLGYFCNDGTKNEAGNLVFNKTVGLRDSWAKIEPK